MINADNLDVKSLPRVDLSKRLSLPTYSGIYFLLDENYTVLYIGRAGNMNYRWRDHWQLIEKIDGKSGLSIAWIECEYNETDEESEKELIRRFLPAFNTMKYLYPTNSYIKTKAHRIRAAAAVKSLNMPNEKGELMTTGDNLLTYLSHLNACYGKQWPQVFYETWQEQARAQAGTGREGSQ